MTLLAFLQTLTKDSPPAMCAIILNFKAQFLRRLLVGTCKNKLTFIFSAVGVGDLQYPEFFCQNPAVVLDRDIVVAVVGAVVGEDLVYLLEILGSRLP